MRSAVARVATYGLGLVVVVGLIGVHLAAQVVAGPAAPEIDGSSVAAGLGLLTGAIVILRSRRRTK